MKNSLPCCPGIYRRVLCLGLKFANSKLKKKKKKTLTKAICFHFILSSLLWEKNKTYFDQSPWTTLDVFFPLLTGLQKLAYLSFLGSSSPLSIGHCSFTGMDWSRLYCCVLWILPNIYASVVPTLTPTTTTAFQYLGSTAQEVLT